MVGKSAKSIGRIKRVGVSSMESSALATMFCEIESALCASASASDIPPRNAARTRTKSFRKSSDVKSSAKRFDHFFGTFHAQRSLDVMSHAFDERCSRFLGSIRDMFECL